MPYKDPAKRREASRRYRERNREKLRAKSRERNCPEYKKAYYEKNRKSIRRRQAEYYEKNKEVIREQQRLYYRSDPSRFAMYSRTRRGVQEKATPSWLTLEQRKYIRSLYRFARNVSGVNKYHVDHIVPLQEENICGLHVPWNLQVIPAKDNRSKGNKYESDWG